MKKKKVCVYGGGGPNIVYLAVFNVENEDLRPCVDREITFSSVKCCCDLLQKVKMRCNGCINMLQVKKICLSF